MTITSLNDTFIWCDDAVGRLTFVHLPMSFRARTYIQDKSELAHVLMSPLGEDRCASEV